MLIRVLYKKSQMLFIICCRSNDYYFLHFRLITWLYVHYRLSNVWSLS